MSASASARRRTRASSRATSRRTAGCCARRPPYLAKHGMPKVPNDLTKHNCIGIRQGEEAYGVWRLASGRGKSAQSEAVKIARQPDHQRRRDRGELGARRPRHPDARRVGHRAIPAQRAPGRTCCRSTTRPTPTSTRFIRSAISLRRECAPSSISWRCRSRSRRPQARLRRGAWLQLKCDPVDRGAETTVVRSSSAAKGSVDDVLRALRTLLKSLFFYLT